MLKSIEGNFDNPEVHEFLIKHFIELRSVSPEGSAHVLDIAGLKDPSIKFWSLWEESDLMGVNIPTTTLKGSHDLERTGSPGFR